MAIKFKINETVNKFAGRFLLDALILYNAYAINNFDVNVAMKQAVAPYHNLAMIMNHAIVENRNAKELVEWMSKSAHLFKEPTLKSQTKVNNPITGKSFTSNQNYSSNYSNNESKTTLSNQRPNSSSNNLPQTRKGHVLDKEGNPVTCSFCQKKGHTDEMCYKKHPKVHVVTINKDDYKDNIPDYASGKDQAE